MKTLKKEKGNITLASQSNTSTTTLGAWVAAASTWPDSNTSSKISVWSHVGQRVFICFSVCCVPLQKLTTAYGSDWKDYYYCYHHYYPLFSDSFLYLSLLTIFPNIEYKGKKKKCCNKHDSFTSLSPSVLHSSCHFEYVVFCPLPITYILFTLLFNFV